jgi:tRNA(Ile2)-agmatinylcytidine synthase
MICLVGIDDTDSSAGFCTTYLAYRVACDLRRDLKVLPYPRLVRLNPNVPFKTRGNAAVCLPVWTADPGRAFERISALVSELSDEKGGANPGLVFLEDLRQVPRFTELYQEALTGMVNVHRVKRMLSEEGARSMTLGNGMGLVGAASALGFDDCFDHTFELISYRRREDWGSVREVDPSSVLEMERSSFPHTFNSYDHQKKKVLIMPHGPDPVFAGVRGDSPGSVLGAFRSLRYKEELEGYMVYLSNQHTDAHLGKKLDWKVYSAGWLEGTVEGVSTGRGGHVYVALRSGGRSPTCAVYEPTGDLRRVARLLSTGDRVKVYGGVRRATSLHPKVLNVERIDVLALAGGSGRMLRRGSYVSSPRSNRHLTKPLLRYGRECPGEEAPIVEGWLRGEPRSIRALVESRR